MNWQALLGTRWQAASRREQRSLMLAVAVLALGVQRALGIEEWKGEIGRKFGEVLFLPLQFVEQIVFLHFYSPLRLGGREN